MADVKEYYLTLLMGKKLTKLVNDFYIEDIQDLKFNSSAGPPFYWLDKNGWFLFFVYIYIGYNVINLIGFFVLITIFSFKVIIFRE